MEISNPLRAEPLRALWAPALSVARRDTGPNVALILIFLQVRVHTMEKKVTVTYPHQERVTSLLSDVETMRSQPAQSSRSRY